MRSGGSTFGEMSGQILTLISLSLSTCKKSPDRSILCKLSQLKLIIAEIVILESPFPICCLIFAYKEMGTHKPLVATLHPEGVVPLRGISR